MIQVQVCPKSNFLIFQPITAKFDTNPTLCQMIFKMYLILGSDLSNVYNLLIPQPISTKFDTHPTLCQLILKMYLIQVQVCPKFNFFISPISTKFDTNPTLCQLILKMCFIQVQACPKFRFPKSLTQIWVNILFNINYF